MNLYKTWSDSDRVVRGESCMFAGVRQANLLFPVKKIIRVYQPQENLTYQDGVDYLWEEGSNQLTLTETSAIPSLTKEQLTPSAKDAVIGKNALDGGPDNSFLIFDNADFFARHQIEVDYEATAIDFPDLIGDQSAKFPRLRRKLAAGQLVEVVHLGDSISDGFNATKFVGIPPYNPTWSEQFVEYLKEKFHAPIQYRNFAINGSGCLSALDNRALWINRKIDLLIIAYGMNDQSLGTRAFLDTYRLIISLARRFNPDVEILLVASMTGHPLWVNTNPKKHQEQFEGLVKLAAEYGNDTALANVHDVWQECLRRKDFYSMTGNGINHPNDFGHKIYMGVLQKLFLDR